MRQLTQNLKDGAMELLEIPVPSAGRDRIVVRTAASVVSTGTEGRSVRDARAGLVEKALARPKEVKQVVDTVKKLGVLQTYRLVKDRLESPSPLGYSLAGTVVEVGSGVRGFAAGDRVACGGQGAVHAEVVSVLPNLCVPVPDGVSMEAAAFTTVGSVAMHGVRQADVRLGETCAVIGLGLLGQLSVQILQAAGVRVVGIDLEPSKVELAREGGVDLALARDAAGLEERVLALTGGHGVDAVLITAATPSTDPVDLAGRLARRKAVVVSVGRVSTDFDRDTYYYKELDLRMSCSYGPGRYDTTYEEKGIDYPVEYVRWSENRNMRAFVELLDRGEVDLEPLLTHRFPFDRAPEAYDLLSDEEASPVGIVLSYPETEVPERPPAGPPARRVEPGALNVGFIGAGSFARKFLLPDVAKAANPVAVATRTGHSAEHVRRKYGFARTYGDGMEVAGDPDVDTVFIATRHDTHARYVLACLEEGKNVFVEKPLCLTEEEMEEIRVAYDGADAHLMVGYNRRFAPMVRTIVDTLGADTLKTIHCRVSTGPIDPDHWTLDPDIGGGRILGELCHFVDLALHLAGSEPERLVAVGPGDPVYGGNTASTLIRFRNGSTASLDYFTNGSEEVGKERIEVHSNGSTAVIDDFRELEIVGNESLRSRSRMDKGHANEVAAFLEAVRAGGPTPIPFREIHWTSRLTFDVLRSMRNGRIIDY